MVTDAGKISRRNSVPHREAGAIKDMCIALLAAGYRENGTTVADAASRAVRQVDDACLHGKLGELWRHLDSGEPEKLFDMYRTGTQSNVHNIYLVNGGSRRDLDEHVGMMFTPKRAKLVVLALNAYGVQ